MISSSPRVRFAPSPTGYLHVGGLRTALYNYLFARKNGGTFILRIEDTDRTRLVEGAVENLIDTLSWAGLDYDEGPVKGGEYGPYVQSERLALYREHADQLLKAGKAYRCFCTPERLDQMRKLQEKMRIPPKYDRTCLKLSAEEVEAKIAEGIPHVLRMRVPEAATISFHDIIRGDVEFASDRLDDQVLMKSDGYPTYHLANVVDDHAMKITHVIRGEEWLSSTPKHVLLYRDFGWEIPIFAHLPLLLNADRSKLSKRQGDVAVEDYRAKGYLKESLVNFVALLGWNPGTDKEVFSLEELINEFSLERVGKAGAIFNVDKLDWVSQQQLRLMPNEKIAAELTPLLETEGMPVPAPDQLNRIIALLKERVNFIKEYADFGSYFFRDPEKYDEAAQKKNWSPESRVHLTAYIKHLEMHSDLTALTAEQDLRAAAEECGAGAGKVIHAVRLALTGISIGPGLFELIEVLGRETTLRRLKRAVEVLP
jgi:glutamyl-tRNA synthetase